MHLSEPFPELCLNVESGRCLIFRVSKTVTVNQDTDHHLWTYVLVLIVTGTVNLTSAIIIWRKETTGINKMIICDCLFNMANMAVYSTNMSSWRLLGSSELCTSWLFFLMVRIKWLHHTMIMVIKCWSPDHNMIIIWSHHDHDHQVLITWSNLVPVAIAVQRYLLVCRAVFCHSVGGKKIWKYIHSAVILLGTLCGTAFVFERDSSLTFLRCMGQEEKFWSVPVLRIIADSAQT